MLRACEKQKEEQSSHITLLERELSSVVGPSPVKAAFQPDMDFYITMSENAQKRVETLERENLQVGGERFDMDLADHY
jgi:hypothetical protein